MRIDNDELVDGFLTAAKLANPSVQLDKSAIRVSPWPAPHDPGRGKFRKGKEQAVYAFFLSDLCLKVGKAGPRSGARFIYQHYGVKRAGSSLARSLLRYKDCQAFHELLGDADHSAIQGLDEDSVGAWIREHTGRLDIVMPANTGLLTLNFLEAFVQCRLQPVFEGKPQRPDDPTPDDPAPGNGLLT